jgi:hypothetical protein
LAEVLEAIDHDGISPNGSASGVRPADTVIDLGRYNEVIYFTAMNAQPVLGDADGDRLYTDARIDASAVVSVDHWRFS